MAEQLLGGFYIGKDSDIHPPINMEIMSVMLKGKMNHKTRWDIVQKVPEVYLFLQHFNLP